MSEITSCLLCKSTDVEVIEDEIMCKDCGFGYVKGATELSMGKNFVMIFDLILKVKSAFPELAGGQITDKVCEVLHKVEGHPTRKDDYCEYCEKVKL